MQSDEAGSFRLEFVRRACSPRQMGKPANPARGGEDVVDMLRLSLTGYLGS
jgi:hypothetical protein